MTPRVLRSLIPALLLAAPAAAQTAAEQELIALEHRYARALVAKDMAFLRAYYAPDWRGGNWNGFFTRSTLLQRLRDRRYVVKSMRLRDVRARVIGEVGIVQGVDEEVTSMSGRDTSGLWGFTDIFERRGGRWVAVASQTTRIDPSRP
jgi:hypothetical protein